MEPITDKEVKELKHSQRMPSYIIVGKCLRCGICCEYIECNKFNKETRECTIYKNRPACCRVSPHNRHAIREFGCKGFKCLRG